MPTNTTLGTQRVGYKGGIMDRKVANSRLCLFSGGGGGACMVGRLGRLPPVVILAVFFLVRGGDGDDGDDGVKGAGYFGGFTPVFILIFLT